MTDQSGRPADARLRSARTKRDRTRAALLHAAQTSFGLHGWAGTRMESVAATAGVSPATAYNHFATKHVLIAHVVRPYVDTLVAHARQDVSEGRPVAHALADQVGALVSTMSRHRRLSGAFLAACQDYAARVHAPPRADDPLDPRVIAPLSEAIRLLVDQGQRTGQLPPYPPAEDISAMIATLLLLRGIEAPDEPPAETTRLMLTVLFGALSPTRLPA
ncbi:MAG: TetR/AcrR family transcriptional regulator [Pseudonocardia sp.]